ncbi:MULTISPECIES: AraC family transcriptional regulator [Enterococcus]|uniref:AraC family transcriptional regulator n=1 Tax=Enterococcus TaxID=1350 RepID=UPI0010FF718D|nr:MULTISPECIES: AraC family transcriptional regulator [Enterococcus]QCT90864.1 AraC family transcriptional regulator [Enterococcus sp. M190262]GMG57885.1 helix-turn-helix domain-containing protein [Enterococcus gallinarum]
MHAWEAIDQSLRYIEEHISEEINAQRLADQVYLSKFYFQRLFKRLVHRPVQEYIKLRRLAIALELLKTTDLKIIDIANQLGFTDPSNFTRIFKEAYNLTPEVYRKTRPRMNVIRKPNLFLNYHSIDEGVPLIVNEIVIEIEKKELDEELYLGYNETIFLGKQLPVGQQTGVDQPGELWRTFHQKKHTLKGIVDTDVEVGISDLASHSQNHFHYFVGARTLDAAIPVSADMVTKIVPGGLYIVCKIEAETKEKLVTEALNEAYRYLFDVWLPKHEIRVSSFSLEKYYKKEQIPSIELCLKVEAE